MLIFLDLLQNEAPKDTSNRKRLLRDCAVECLATTLFVYGGTLGAVSTGQKLNNQGNVAEDVARILPIAVCFGVSILSLVYAIGHITGGHMNPGVSLMMACKRQMSFPKMFCYWIAQLLGAMLASALVWGSTSEISGLDKTSGGEINRPPFLLGSTTLSDAISAGNGFLIEFMGSFIFYFVIAQTALDERGVAKTSFPAIPIGLILVVVHVCLIPFTGCGVNPARTFGPAVVTCMGNGDLCDEAIGEWWWIYWVGPFMASLGVAEVTHWMSMDVDDEGDGDDDAKEGDAEQEKEAPADEPIKEVQDVSISEA